MVAAERDVFPRREKKQSTAKNVDKNARRDNEDEGKFQDRVELHNTLLKESRNIAEVIMAKQRHGPVGTVELHFNGDLTKFSDLDPYHHDPDGDF